MLKPIISLKGVDILQQKQLVFKNLYLEINARDFLYFVGETGSGKSSFLKSLYGDIKISSGSLMVADFNLTDDDWTQMGTVRQDEEISTGHADPWRAAVGLDR